MVFVGFGRHTPRRTLGEFALYCVLRKPLAVVSNDGRYLYSGIGFIPPGRNRRRSERQTRTRRSSRGRDVTADVIVSFERFLVVVLLQLFFFHYYFCCDGKSYPAHPVTVRPHRWETQMGE